VLTDAPEELLHVALEHRLMHAETFAYLLHNLSPEHKLRAIVPAHEWGTAPVHRMCNIAAGAATLGRAPRNGFGWDNEFDAQTLNVPGFSISKYKVTNAQYMAFVRAGAAPPPFWIRRQDQWFLRTMFDEIPLPAHWPVYATLDEAQAYAAWTDQALPTEAQFHRAAYGIPTGGESAYPWGDAPPDTSRGNFDFHRWDPVAVTASPAGDSAFGISQLVGNGWEWTSSVFAPFPGFHAFQFYPGYSAPFFGQDHYVLKGGSPRTAAQLLRRSFRNWFRPNYRHMYASFRCVEN
jgi:formylglycine-generating enzyme required for sulfatase activity